MNLTQKQQSDEHCYYGYYLYARNCIDGSHTVAIHRNFDDALQCHPAQCLINGRRYPATWATENPLEGPFTLKIKLDNGEWHWLTENYTHVIESITHVNVRAANTDENINDFFFYISHIENKIDVAAYRSLDDAILAHRPPPHISVACWNARAKDRWEISLGKKWQYETGRNIRVIVKATLGCAIQVCQHKS